MAQPFHIDPIGVVRKKDGKVWVDIEPQYGAGLSGLDGFSHIVVLYWFDRNDTPQSRGILQVHPRKDTSNPLTGVFATHAPMRPNPIAMTICRLLSIEKNRLHLDTIDALDASPVIDIKCYIPENRMQTNVRVPQWVKNGMEQNG